jgi:hypothetical protein
MSDHVRYLTRTDLRLMAAIIAIFALVVLVKTGRGGADSVGAGIQPGPVRVKVVAGQSATAHVQVQDTGSDPENLSVVGGRFRGEQIVPLGWVHGAGVNTDPNRWKTLTFTVTVPLSTPPGRYQRLVGVVSGATPAPAGISETTRVAAYTRLIINVTNGASHD